ncbi:hypothetical protein GCM10022199_13240 [Marihabitans asiaticum]
MVEVHSWVDPGGTFVRDQPPLAVQLVIRGDHGPPGYPEPGRERPRRRERVARLEHPGPDNLTQPVGDLHDERAGSGPVDRERQVGGTGMAHSRTLSEVVHLRWHVLDLHTGPLTG